MGATVKQLSENFRPSHYELEMDFGHKDQFSGTVIMHGKKIGRPSSRITLHQKDLKIKSAEIIKKDKSGDKTIAVSRINRQRSLDEVRVHAAERLMPGDYIVKLNFSGAITE